MIRYCTLCERQVEPKRHFGIGTLIACLVTSGLWLIAMPFYRKRCPICRGSSFAVGAAPKPAAARPRANASAAALEQMAGR